VEHKFNFQKINTSDFQDLSDFQAKLSNQTHEEFISEVNQFVEK